MVRIYYPVKESIDGIRLALGLPRLPSLQEESDKLQASYSFILFIFIINISFYYPFY